MICDGELQVGQHDVCDDKLGQGLFDWFALPLRCGREDSGDKRELVPFSIPHTMERLFEQSRIFLGFL